MAMLDINALAALQGQEGPGWLRAILANAAMNAGGAMPSNSGMSPNEALPDMSPVYRRDPPRAEPQSHAEPNEVWSHNNYGGDGPLIKPLPLPVEFGRPMTAEESKVGNDIAVAG